MPRSSQTNIPEAELRWSLAAASREFGFSIPTIRAALKNVVPGEDNCFSTQEICASLYGALHLEKIKTQVQITRKLELENAITTGSVLDKAALQATFAELADCLRQTVYNDSNLSREAKENFLSNLATWPLRLKDVAKRQTRFNGKEPQPEEENENE
jgi:hypothetical protein